jgi:hypothetical protein
MNERDKELAKQAWVENDWDGYLSVPKLIAFIRADEREEILKLADSLGWVNVDDIRARGNT